MRFSRVVVAEVFCDACWSAAPATITDKRVTAMEGELSALTWASLHEGMLLVATHGEDATPYGVRVLSWTESADTVSWEVLLQPVLKESGSLTLLRLAFPDGTTPQAPDDLDAVAVEDDADESMPPVPHDVDAAVVDHDADGSMPPAPHDLDAAVV